MKRSSLPPRKKPLARSSKPLKRTELKRGTVHLERTALKPAKPHGRARPDERLATWCEMAVGGVCTGRAQHRHHKRGRVGADADDREHTLDCCDSCHRYAHAHPAESYEQGWMERRVT